LCLARLHPPLVSAWRVRTSFEEIAKFRWEMLNWEVDMPLSERSSRMIA
jgi:hypothetical protein